jgi:hypothetical protein
MEDEAVVARQLGRHPRALRRVVVRCPYGRPAVTEQWPRDVDGAPFPTTYYLTIADSHIMMHSELEHVDLLCINDPTAILHGGTLEGLQPGDQVILSDTSAYDAVDRIRLN